MWSVPFSFLSHLNRYQIESNRSVPGIQGCHKNARIESFEMSTHMECIWTSIKIPLGPAFGSGLDSGWPQRDVGTDISKGGSFWSSYRGRSRGTLGFQVHSCWIRSYLLLSVNYAWFFNFYSQGQKLCSLPDAACESLSHITCNHF